jgi:hypothetical protein
MRKLKGWRVSPLGPLLPGEVPLVHFLADGHVITMTPEQARQLADALVKVANDVDLMEEL